jgi:hypothetical protein
MESIHDLFDKVQKHPDYVFGTVFVREDFTPENVEKIKDNGFDLQDTIIVAGWEAVEHVTGDDELAGYMERKRDQGLTALPVVAW